MELEIAKKEKKLRKEVKKGQFIMQNARTSKKGIDRPYDVAYAANVKGLSLGVTAAFGYAADNGDSPMKAFAGYSKFELALIDKNAAIKCVVANVKADEFPHIYKRTEAAFEKCIASECAPVSSSASASPAYTVRFTMGTFKGKTPAEILSSDPSSVQKLLDQHAFLSKNADKYAANRSQMDAIMDAVHLMEEGKLSGEAAAAPSMPPMTIHESGPRPLFSKKDMNGKTFVYELKITATAGRNYPFEVRIRNYYAPVTRKDGGQLNIQRGDAEHDVTHAMLLSANEFYDIISEMKSELDLFRFAHSAKAVKDAAEAREANIASSGKRDAI